MLILSRAAIGLHSTPSIGGGELGGRAVSMGRNGTKNIKTENNAIV